MGRLGFLDFICGAARTFFKVSVGFICSNAKSHRSGWLQKFTGSAASLDANIRLLSEQSSSKSRILRNNETHCTQLAE